MKSLLIIITIILSANMSMGHQISMANRSGKNLRLPGDKLSYLIFDDQLSRIARVRGCSTRSLIKISSDGRVYPTPSSTLYNCSQMVDLKLATKTYVDDHYHHNEKRINDSMKILSDKISTTETRVTNKLSVYLSEIVELKVQEKNDEEAAIAAKNALNREDIREMIRRIVREENREVRR